MKKYMRYPTKLILSVVVITITLMTNTLFAQNPTAVATLTKVNGKVEVQISKMNKRTMGREGLLLYQDDTIITGQGGRVTVLFRDGSEIRLFENTQFMIETGKEQETEQRSFRYNFFMKMGSFWGKMQKSRQQTSIKTPTATIGVKGTSLRVSTNETASSIALTEGLISVDNKNSSIELVPGKRVVSISSTDDLSKKIEDIPYKLFITADSYDVDFTKTQQSTIRLSIQLGNVQTGQNLGRSGKLYLRSNYPNIQFPENVELDASGFVRFPIEINSPRYQDQEFDGNVTIWAVPDDAKADDIGEGSILIKIKSASKTRHYHIDGNTGEISPVK
ncbi:MAG: FecR domain-containing protein [SAR324 cluster bacterium]|nr:FecR domain-containing protein [SAR324 cluster bacterium]